MLTEGDAETSTASTASESPASQPVPSQTTEEATPDQVPRKKASTSDDVSKAIRRLRRDISKPASGHDIPYYSNKRRDIKTKPTTNKRPKSIIDAVKSSAARAFKRSGVGYRVYGKIIPMLSRTTSSQKIGFRDIGIGLQEVMAAITQDPEMFNRLLYANTHENVDVSGWSSSEIVNYVNSHEIYVGTFKPPNNRGQDVQRRRLRILSDHQRGIYVHPIMAAMYTADFDGDDMEVSFDPDVADLARDPMSYMVGIDGKQSLNTDFLAVSKFEDGYEEGKVARDYVREVIFSAFSQLDGRTIGPLVDAVLDLGESADKDSDAQALAWGDVFRQARAVSDRVNPGNQSASDDMMSKLCEAVYNGMHQLRVRNALTSIEADVLDIENLPEPRTYDDSAIYKVLDGIVSGEVPNNFQDLKVALSGFIGNVKGKNAPFRFSADVGKMMKMDSRLQIGDGTFVVDPNNRREMSLFFESTMKFSTSWRMAREIKQAGRSQYYTQLMRSLVIQQVGFPETYNSFHDFLAAFAQSYRANSAMINEANLVYLSNMGISSDSNRGIVSPLEPSQGGITIGDLAEPLLSIYGSYSVGRMFQALSTSGAMGNYVDPLWQGNPNAQRIQVSKHGWRETHPNEWEYDDSSYMFWITGKYLSYSLSQFKNENRLVRGKSSVKKILGTRIDSLVNVNDVRAQLQMLLAIADKRTGAESKFNTKVYGAMEGGHTSGEGTTVQMMADLLTDMARVQNTESRDQGNWMNDIVQTLVESGPDMFLHFGMDNMDGFLQSSWAQKMIEHASDPEVLGGIRTAMVFDYRMERVDALRAELQEADPNVDLDRYKDVVNNAKFAIDELAASSEVWSGIIKEMRAEDTEGEESVFSILARHGRPTHKTIVGDGEYSWDLKHFDADYFWADTKGHTSLRSVIEDLDMDRRTKWNVIADIVRYWEHDAYLESWEVGYQLEIGSDSSYSLDSGASQGALSVHRDFEKAFNRWGNVSQQRMQENVSEAFKEWGDKPDMLLRTLTRLDNSPWELISISDDMYADAILSVMDKTYAQTEKASQHPWTNAVYAALSFQRNGSYMNDVTRTNDRLIGITSVKSIGVQDIIHLLADSEAMLEVYNEYGEVGVLTREALLTNALGRELSGNLEADIWQFLQMEPRIASAIKAHSACVVADTDGSGFVGAQLSMKETIGKFGNGPSDPIGHVKYLMRDHPIYAGIVSMAVPAKGSVTRNRRFRMVEVENYLANQIYAYASSNMPAEVAAREILADMGITVDTLRSTMRSDYDVFLEQMGLPTRYDNGESDDDADFTYEVVSQNLAKYIEDEVRKSVPLGRQVSELARPDGLGIDISSVASFWDVLQELGGAKTAVSTGIEGAETYQFAEWASHISAKDRYADLEAVPEEDFDPSWNGAWTSLRNEDGSPMLLEVDESGSVTNYDALIEAKKAQGMDEVIVIVPNGYDVKDRSTDSHGTPVPSLFAYMVSKRSNGAEAFNLKAKKAGLDGKDSVTKMQGRLRMVRDELGEHPASYLEIQEQLRKIAQRNGENGLMAARMELALMMLQENADLGYDDLTLSNYMGIADLMLIMGNDGQLHLRSLEMLMNAIKYRLGPAVDEMTDEEVREAADAIVSDASEYGVGIAQMASPLDALDNFRPRPKASSVSGIRSNSSVFERNYNLLSTIQEFAKGIGVTPISPNIAEQLTSRYVDRKNGISGVSNVFGRSTVVRNYNVVGYAAATEAAEEINWTIGPSNMIVIGEGDISDQRVAEICHKAYELGMTVMVSRENSDKIPSEMQRDCMPCSDKGDVIIPCFDMRLNGAESAPYNGGRFAIFQAPFSRYVVSVEDSINEYQLGDAQYRPTRAFADRIKVVDNGSKSVRAEELFPNVFRNPAFKHSMTTVTLASGGEIENLIANGVRCTIDYGIVEGGRGFGQRKRDVDAAIKRYQDRWSEADADGIIRMTECHPGDIVGWAECEITDQYTGEVQYVLAPIIPFPLHGATKNVPETFTVEQLGTVDNDNTLLSVDWSNTSEIEGSFAKYFDSSGGANKGMIDFADIIESDLLLRDGTHVDAYCAKASTDSRKIGTDRRIKTMISLMTLARMHGYNFARSEGAFPTDPAHPENEDIRERLLSRRIPTSEWRGWLAQEGGMLFTNDQRLNAFLNFECRKILMDGGNPSDYLANVYTDQNGVEHNTHVMWEFEAMFDQGLNYEDGLLRFLHTMDPTLCPESMDDGGEYMFRLYRDSRGNSDGYDVGVLQMQVPHRLSDGSMSYLWDNVYIGMSFFGEDYSGFSRPNVDGASNFLDAMNTMSYYGTQLDERATRFRAMWASADIGRRPRDGGALGKA